VKLCHIDRRVRFFETMYYIQNIVVTGTLWLHS